MKGCAANARVRGEEAYEEDNDHACNQQAPGETGDPGDMLGRQHARVRACVRHHHRLGATGPVFGYSDTWQLVINTGTTIVTFLMVFLIQRSQNKDSLAIHLKLNELVAAVNGASNRLIEVEVALGRGAARARAALPQAGQHGEA